MKLRCVNCELSLLRAPRSAALRPWGLCRCLHAQVCPLESAFLARVTRKARAALREPTATGRCALPHPLSGGRLLRASGPIPRLETRILGLFLPPPRFGATRALTARLLRTLRADDAIGPLSVGDAGDHVILVSTRVRSV